MLSARALEHAYGNREVLSVDTLVLERATTTAVVGPNGSGKSTLLRLLAFVERPRRGEITLDGHSVAAAGDRRRARRRVTLVEQHPYLFPGSVRRNVRYALSLHGARGPAADRRADEVLERLHLHLLAEREARELSAGETQRVALARALALTPDVLLLDEPASAVDRAAVVLLSQVLDEERARGTAVCLTSHQVEQAYRWSDRLLALADGRVSPVAPENLFRTVLPDGTGTKQAAVGPLTVTLVTDKSGPATLAIPPDEILLSLTPLQSSARNQFRGQVVRISDDGRGGVTLMVDAGVEVAVRITPAALDELGLRLRSSVVLSVKAHAVRVF